MKAKKTMVCDWCGEEVAASKVIVGYGSLGLSNVCKACRERNNS